MKFFTLIYTEITLPLIFVNFRVSKLKTIESDLKERNKSLKEFQKKVEVLQEKVSSWLLLEDIAPLLLLVLLQVLSLEKAREGQEEEEHIYEEPPEVCVCVA